MGIAAMSAPSFRASSCLFAALTALALSACQDSQSSLAAQGPEAARIATLAWVLFIGATVIMVGMIAMWAVATFGSERARRWLSREAVVVGGGIVFPAVTLSILLAYGLLLTRAGGAAESGDEPMRISIVGEQWWWRVIYEAPGGSSFESANEIRIPTGRRVELALTTADVIHSFWVPNLAGKVDMIPGRTNQLTFTADNAGSMRGQCAEYCGGAHALMAFNVIAMEPDAFNEWMARESGPATLAGGAPEEGEALFLASGCGGCHSIRGTGATGTIGPDLTHVGSRTSLAAATLPNTPKAMAAWIADNQHIKPDNLMPPFHIFSEAELTALSSYLSGLQ
jgi:cytochrome c oxidase subunit 2